MRPAVSRLDVYLLRELVKSTLIGSLVAVVVLLGLQALRLSDFIIRAGLEPIFVLRMLAGMALSFTPLVVPIAFLFALLFVFGRMSTDREFVALQAMGRSPRRLLQPCIWFGAMMCLVSIACSFGLGPSGNSSFEASIDEAYKRKVAAALRSGTFSEGFLNMVLFVESVDAVTQDLNHVFLFDETNFREPTVISAKRGRWVESVEQGLGTLKLMDGVLFSSEPDKKTVRRVRFDEYRIHADFTRQVGYSKESPPSLGWQELVRRRSEAQSRPEVDPRPIWTELSRRFAVSFACLLFVPLCFGLSLDNTRTARSRAVGMGLVILLAYWTVYFSLATWLLKGSWAPLRTQEWLNWTIIWIPNFVLAGAGFFMLRRRNI